MPGVGSFGRGEADLGAGFGAVVFADHLPDIGDAFSTLWLASQAIEHPGGRTGTAGQCLFDLLLGKSVTDTDVHGRRFAVVAVSVGNANENDCQLARTPIAFMRAHAAGGMPKSLISHWYRSAWTVARFTSRKLFFL